MKDREKKVVALEKIFQKPRFQIMDMFDLPRGSGAEGSKGVSMDWAFKFLEKPAG